MRTSALVILAASLLIGCSAQNDKGHGAKNAEYYYSLAVNSYYDQNAQLALRELDTCFKLDPKLAKAHHLAGLIFLGRKEYADSLYHLKEAIKLDERYTEARANLGALYIAMSNWQKAIELLTPIARNPVYPTPYLVENNLGWAYFKMGNLTQAETHLKRALFLNDKMCLAYSNIGVVHTEQGRMEDALDDFEAAIARCPQFVEPYFRAGALLERSSRFAEATKRFKKCKRLGGDSVYGRRCKRKLQALK